MKLFVFLTFIASATYVSALPVNIEPRRPLVPYEFKHRRGNLQPNIVGGRPVKPEFKYGQWMVAIQRGVDQFCAGSMFGKNLMVTAARKPLSPFHFYHD